MTNTIHPREKLIQTAAGLVHQQGWTATGINQILSDAGIPKGSFYYYFRSKEALGAAVLQMHHEALGQLLTKTLLNAELPADVAVYELLKELTTRHQPSGFRFGCPIGSLANEIATQSATLLSEANQSLTLYEESWAALIRRGQRDGIVSPDIDPGEAGTVATMLLQGAFLKMKCTASLVPLELAHAAIHQLAFGDKEGRALSRPSAAELPRLHALAS